MQSSLQASLLNVGNLDRSIEFKAKTGPTSTRWSTRSASDQETDKCLPRAPSPDLLRAGSPQRRCYA